MSPRRRGAFAFAALLLGSLSSPASAQTGGGFDLSWNSIDGGGGESSGGGFSVAGTIAQPDAGVLAGASFDLVGGFWAIASSGPPPGGCVGDCDGRGTVTVDELVTGVNIALGVSPLANCPSFDSDRSQTVTVDELVRGVNNALEGC